MKGAATLFLFAIGCSHPTTTASQPVEQANDRPSEEVEVDSSSMLKHWVAVTRIRDALIAGDLEEAVTAAGPIAEHEATGVPVAWMPYVQNMRGEAQRVAGARSIEDAAQATADLAANCGGCHSATGAGVQMPTGRPPAEGRGDAAHMRRHVWASNAMWEGLVGPSTGRWQDGASVLAEQPMHQTDHLKALVVTDEVAQLSEHVHDLGTRASGVTDPTERAAIYADLLGTCATCHGLTRPPSADE